MTSVEFARWSEVWFSWTKGSLFAKFLNRMALSIRPLGMSLYSFWHLMVQSCCVFAFCVNNYGKETLYKQSSLGLAPSQSVTQSGNCKQILLLLKIIRNVSFFSFFFMSQRQSFCFEPTLVLKCRDWKTCDGFFVSTGHANTLWWQ